MRIVVLMLASLLALPASAQLVPRPDAPSLARDAGPRARFVTSTDGRVSRAWSLAVRAPSAIAFLDRYRADLALPPNASLRLDRIVTAHRLTHARFVRTTLHGDVMGSSIVVRMTSDGAVDYVTIAPPDALPIASVHRTIDPAAASRIALAHTAALRVLDVAPIAIPVGGELVPGWRVDTAGTHLHERDRVVVDGRDGSVRLAFSRTLDVLGRVYARNPISDEGVTTDVELPFLTSREYLTGRYFRVATCNASARGCEQAQLATSDSASGDFLYDPQEPSFTDPFSEVHAYHHTNRIAQYFRDVHAFTWMCGDSPLMRVFVNYTETAGVPFDNAAYAPTSASECGFMLFGQGEDRDYAYDADVVYHENTHSVVDGVAGLGPFLETELGFSFAPGSINEGIADYFAATLAGDPALAEYFMGAGSGAAETALRRLDNDLSCPNDLVGEVHFDGRIWAGLGWDLREALGPAKSDALMFATLAALPEAPSLGDAAEILAATAAALTTEAVLGAGDTDVVGAAIAARGLEACEPIAPLDEGALRIGFSGEPSVTPSAGSLAPVQYRVDVPADAMALRITIAPSGETIGSYRLYGQVGGPVRFASLSSSETYRPDADGVVAIDRASLRRCETLYLAVAQDDLTTVGPTLYEIRAELDRSGLTEECPGPDAGPPPMPDAGTIATDAGSIMEMPDDGCGCRATSSGDRGAALLLLIAWAFSRRRRP